MRLNKRILGIVGAGIVSAGILAGCGASSSTTTTADSDKINIVTTVYPEYDWVKNIVDDNSENVNVELLLSNGIDMHSYQPSIEDIAKISDCDLFIYVGGESDDWVEDALKNATNKDMKVIKLLDVLGENAKEEETVEGMQTDEESHEHSHDEDEGEETAYDEHVWLSIKNAQTFVNEITSNLSELDSSNSEKYIANADNYNTELAALNDEYIQAISASSVKTLLFADRFPFRYMVDDYDLAYYAAFDGCSAETEASFETITFLANKVDELGLNSVIKIDGSDGKIAQTVVDNTKDKNQNILTLNSMQSVTDEDISNGTTYLSIMKDNLEVLKQALK